MLAFQKRAANDKSPSIAPYTFLKRLLLNQEKNPASLTDGELNTHTIGNMAAGGDTTSTAVRAILANLI